MVRRLAFTRQSTHCAALYAATMAMAPLPMSRQGPGSAPRGYLAWALLSVTMTTTAFPICSSLVMGGAFFITIMAMVRSPMSRRGQEWRIPDDGLRVQRGLTLTMTADWT